MASLATRSRRQRQAIIARGAFAQQVREPEVTTIPSPIGGLNARDSWSDMDPQDAIQLDNWYPGFGKCTVRRGTRLHATLATSGAVETAAELQLSVGRKLLVAAGGGLWDATNGGTISGAVGGTTSFTSNRWQWAAMNNLLLLCNGSNTPQQYNGTTKAAMTIQAGAGEPSLNVTTLIGVHVFKSRAYYWTGKDQDFWYTAVNAHAGDLTQFPLGDVGTFGGVLTLVFSVTRDGGSGPDDFIVFLMSSGEAIVYQGSNPGSADDWALVGVYQIGAPVGIRAWTKIGGDALVATVDGYTLFSKATGATRGARGTNISDKIVNEAVARAKASKGTFGWQVLQVGQRLMVNHPSAGAFDQHVANMATGAWARFRDMDARCWALFDDAPYFGSASGKVYEADTGSSDDGAKIVAEGRQAFNYLGSRSRHKQVGMVRALLEAAGSIPVRIGLATDFETGLGRTVTATIGVSTEPATKWGTAPWGTFKWGAVSRVAQGWLAHSARGYAISTSMRVEQQNAPISWSATSFSYHRVGVT